jgi:hypothetical protein
VHHSAAPTGSVFPAQTDSHRSTEIAAILDLSTRITSAPKQALADQAVIAIIAIIDQNMDVFVRLLTPSSRFALLVLEDVLLMQMEHAIDLIINQTYPILFKIYQNISLCSHRH